MKKSTGKLASVRTAPKQIRALRIDAEKNQEQILQAARRIFAERGLQAPLEEIARHAGVGIATLYRRFPSRDALVAASLRERLNAYVDAIDEALTNPDAWDGFCGFLERAGAMQAADRGLSDLLTMTFPMSDELLESAIRGYAGMHELIDRAQMQGSLRADFVAADVVMWMTANAGVLQATAGITPSAWRRFLGLSLDGFRAERATPLPPAPTEGEAYEVTLRYAERGHARKPSRRL